MADEKTEKKPKGETKPRAEKAAGQKSSGKKGRGGEGAHASEAVAVKTTVEAVPRACSRSTSSRPSPP